MIKLGLNNLKDIKIGSTPVVKVMVGTTLLWELVTIIVDLFTQHIQRVNADGGTYIGEDTDDEIVDDGTLTLLMKPTAHKNNKIYSALPFNGSGDFLKDSGTPTIEYDLVEDGVEMGPDKYGENLYPYSSTMEDFTMGSTTYTFNETADTPPTGFTTVWTSDNLSTYLDRDHGLPTGDSYVRVYTTKSTSGFIGYRSNGIKYPSSTIVDVGGGWYQHTAQIPSSATDMALVYSSSNPFTGFQTSTTLAGLDNYIETTGEAKPYGNYPEEVQLYRKENFRVVVASGDVISVTTPTGTQAIYETVNGITTKTLSIPTTYQLPVGDVEMIKMGKYSHSTIKWVEPVEGAGVFDGEITTLKVNIN